RDRHLVHEPLRLSRSGAGLDRGQGFRPRLHAEPHRLRASDAAEELPPAHQDLRRPRARQQGAMSDRAAARTSIIRALPQYLAERGLGPGPGLLRAGIAGDIADGPARIVTRAQILTALEAASRLLGEAALGLGLGQLSDARQLGPTGHALVVGTS